MIAIRKLFVYFILVIGPGLAVPNFTLEEKNYFYTTILNTHNYFRKLHGAQPLTFNPELVNDARRQVMLLANGGTTNINGLNKSSFRFKDTHTLSFPFAVKVVGDWYSTAEGYDFKAEPTNILSDKFTQIVWKNTTSIAVDIEFIGNILNVVVLYSPPGNESGKYIENVGLATNPAVFNSADIEIARFLLSLSPLFHIGII